MRRLINKITNWVGIFIIVMSGIIKELTPHWVKKFFWRSLSFWGITSDINFYWIKNRFRRIKNISSATTAVYGFYILLVVTPFIGTLVIAMYIYDELMGYARICRKQSDPFFTELKPGIENNILGLLVLLVLNTFVMMLLFS